jgi:hypothetical protein
MDALIAPEGSLEILSQVETGQLRDAGEGGLYELWRQCSLAVLNSGGAPLRVAAWPETAAARAAHPRDGGGSCP